VAACEEQLVGVSVAVSFVALRDGQTLEGYGFWLINCGHFYRGKVDYSEPEDGRGRVVLMLDVERRRMALSFGYYFDGFVKRRESFDVLCSGHANLLDGRMVLGCEQILMSLKGLLKKVVSRARRGAKR